jgi:hypothetical protein
MISGIASTLIMMAIYYVISSIASKASAEGRAKVRTGCGIVVVIALAGLIGSSFMLGTFDKF